MYLVHPHHNCCHHTIYAHFVLHSAIATYCCLRLAFHFYHIHDLTEIYFHHNSDYQIHTTKSINNETMHCMASFRIMLWVSGVIPDIVQDYLCSIKRTVRGGRLFGGCNSVVRVLASN